MTMRKAATLILLLIVAAGNISSAQRLPAVAKETPVDAESLKNLQAVLETSLGEIIVGFYPEAAPHHVNLYVKTSRAGGYDGTSFFRMIKYGIIQGGDPLSKDPKNRARFGTGGLNLLKAEYNDHKNLRGALAAVRVPGQDDSAGQQFYICVTDQPGLDQQRFTVFGRVVRGIRIVERISETQTDEKQIALEPVVIKRVTIRPAQPVTEDESPPARTDAEPKPLELTDAQVSGARVELVTDLGSIVIAMDADHAPETVRHFLCFAKSGFYDGMSISRVVPGFLIQTGDPSTWPEDHPNRKRVWNIDRVKDEFNDAAFDKGITGMAHGSEPGSGSIHFFIMVGRSSALDQKYTAFGRVVQGMDVVDKIAATPVEGERPMTRIEVKQVKVMLP